MTSAEQPIDRVNFDYINLQLVQSRKITFILWSKVFAELLYGSKKLFFCATRTESAAGVLCLTSYPYLFLSFIENT